MYQGADGGSEGNSVAQELYDIYEPVHRMGMEAPDLKTVFLIFVVVIISILYMAKMLTSFMINSSKLQKQSI